MNLPTFADLTIKALELSKLSVGINREDNIDQIAKWLAVEGDNSPYDPFCMAFRSYMDLKALAILTNTTFTPESAVKVFESLKPILFQHYIKASASCGDVMRDAIDKKKWRLRSTSYIPLPGDLVLYDWKLIGSPQHVGRIISTGKNVLYTVEGNVSNADNVNGGVVSLKTRPLNNTVLGFIKMR